jgi:hypothetical protein
MAPKELASWLRERTPEVPPSFLSLLLEYESGDGTVPSPEILTDLGERALEKALSHPGRDRVGAFALLAGDAFITYACEFLAESGADVAGTLDGMIQRLGRRDP